MRHITILVPEVYSNIYAGYRINGVLATGHINPICTAGDNRIMTAKQWTIFGVILGVISILVTMVDFRGQGNDKSVIQVIEGNNNNQFKGSNNSVK